MAVRVVHPTLEQNQQVPCSPAYSPLFGRLQRALLCSPNSLSPVAHVPEAGSPLLRQLLRGELPGRARGPHRHPRRISVLNFAVPSIVPQRGTSASASRTRWTRLPPSQASGRAALRCWCLAARPPLCSDARSDRHPARVSALPSRFPLPHYLPPLLPPPPPSPPHTHALQPPAQEQVVPSFLSPSPQMSRGSDNSEAADKCLQRTLPASVPEGTKPFDLFSGDIFASREE